MLKKYFFISPDSSTRFIIFIVILMLFAFKVFLIFLFAYVLFILLFRKKAINPSSVRTIDPAILLAPCDGSLSEISNEDKFRKVIMQVGFFNHYGIRMPFSGSIRSFTESKEKLFSIGNIVIYKYKTSVVVKSEVLGKIKLHFRSITNLAATRIWVRSGDKATVGAYLGYLPFGGKVVIEIPKDLNILVKENDSLLSAETLLASKGKEHA